MSKSVKSLRPIFTGKTEENEEITLFQHILRSEEFHILLPNDTLLLLSFGSEVSTWFDPTSEEMRVDIVSPEWTGQIKGNKWDLLQVYIR